MTEAAARAVELFKQYGDGETAVTALDHVNVEFARNQFTAIMGPSGSGKSTLMHTMAGLDAATSGSAFIGETDMSHLNDKQITALRRDRLGFIFQSFNLLGTMNAVENVALPLMFRGVPRKNRLEKADKMLDLVGLSKHKNHRPNEMSGGQQQRVGVARALVVEPEIIFADEPTGNLDSNTSAEVMELMKKIVREQNQTLVMVTHDNHLASFADRIFHIIDGKIVQIEDNRGNREEEGE